MLHRTGLHTRHAERLAAARDAATAIGHGEAHRQFVELVRRETPWRFKGNNDLDRYLHSVEHHLGGFVPKLLPSLPRDVRSVFDFGCGSGGSSISLAMLFPEARFHGVDISRAEISIAPARAALFGVGDRCRFEIIGKGQPLPVPDNAFDLCICCSMLEYAIDPDVRRKCVQEMARIIRPGGMLFMTVPNRIYPFELHSGKFGWNYFPQLFKARIVGSTAWEIRALARPYVLSLRRTRAMQLLTPWTNFCLEKQPA